MKWAIAEGVSATKFYRLGWAKALSSIGEDINIWNQDKRPANDLFSEQKIEALMIGSWELTPVIINHVIKNNIKIFLWLPNFGNADNDIDKNDPLDNVQIANDIEKKYVKELVDNNAVKYGVSYYHQKYLDNTHNGWTSLGIQMVGLPLAADILSFPITKPEKQLASDWAFIGGRWPAKAGCIDPYLFPLCHPSNGLSGKIFGAGHWPVYQHLGYLEDALAPRVIASATVCPCIFEPISLKHKVDCSERIYKVLSCGAFAISQSVHTVMNDLFPNGEVVFSTTPEDFIKKVIHFVNKPHERLPYILKGITSVYNRHTYYDRAIELFKLWELPELANKCKEVKIKIINKYADNTEKWDEYKAYALREAI